MSSVVWIIENFSWKENSHQTTMASDWMNGDSTTCEILKKQQISSFSRGTHRSQVHRCDLFKNFYQFGSNPGTCWLYARYYTFSGLDKEEKGFFFGNKCNCWCHPNYFTHFFFIVLGNPSFLERFVDSELRTFTKELRSSRSDD